MNKIRLLIHIVNPDREPPRRESVNTLTRSWRYFSRTRNGRHITKTRSHLNKRYIEEYQEHKESKKRTFFSLKRENLLIILSLIISLYKGYNLQIH